MTDMRSGASGLNLIDSVYERLLAERIIFLGSQVDDDIANRLCAQILLLSAEDPTKDINLYINSPGGSISAGMAIYDTMVLAPCDVATYAMGMAASMGEFLLAAGTKGKRYALPHARILMHQPLRRHRRQRRRHRDPGRAVRGHQEGDVPAQRRVHRSDARAHRGRLRPRPLVHRSGGARVRLRRPHHHQRQLQRAGPTAGLTNDRPRRIAAESDQARYILPSFIEHSSFGIKESNPYNKLFEERIIFLGVQVDDASANDIMAQLLVLESLDPDRDITMYINSPGGSFTSLMAIYDTMQYVRADIQTVCLGQAASAAAVLLAAGTPGKRLALPERPHPDPPARRSVGVIQGQVSDLEIQAAEIERMRTLMETTLAHHTGKDAAVSPQGHRPRQDPHRRGCQGVRHHRHGSGVPQALRAERLIAARVTPAYGSDARSLERSRSRHANGTRCVPEGYGRRQGICSPSTQINITDAIRLYRSHGAGTYG